MNATQAPAPRGLLSRQPALLSAAIVIAAAVVGQIATFPNLRWYETLSKPVFTPPNAAFGPAWSVLYVLMGYAFYRIARLSEATRGRQAAVFAYLLTLVLNALWPLAFFGLHSLATGLVEIAVQIVALLATVALFARVDRVAAAVLTPVVLWVAYAGALNFEIWRLN